MTLGVALSIGVAGGLGALARFLLDGTVAARLGREFPYGTLVVNLTGTFVVGVLLGVTADRAVDQIVGTGLIGAFTTFSTWVFESHRCGEKGELGIGVLNLIVSLLLGVIVAWAGRRLGRAL